MPGGDLGPQSGTFRTVCVRTCDGAYFPVSFATVQARFADDERTCKALCPATEASLFALSQSGRGHQPGGLGQRTALHGAAERIQIPHRVQSVLRLQGGRTDLVGRAEIGRRQGRCRAAGRYHRHRGERQEDAAACAAAGDKTNGRQEGRGDIWRSACCGARCLLGASARSAGRRPANPDRGPDLHPAEAVAPNRYTLRLTREPRASTKSRQARAARYRNCESG